MNRTTNSLVPEMFNCTDVNMTLLEKQWARFKQQQQQQEQEQEQKLLGYYNNLAELCGGGGGGGGGLLGEVVTQSVKSDPDPFGIGWPDLVDGCFESNYDFNSAANVSNSGVSEQNHDDAIISKTSSCPPEAVSMGSGVWEKMGYGVGIGRETSSKKRKAHKVVAQNETGGKRSRGCGEELEPKITQKSSSDNNQNKENSADTSKENISKITEVQKPDYIHVRARRGQATDNHSLAERVRREKISERMKYLQDLVPGCNKITGKAGRLDEIINYVQSLQRQVEFLSIKLAAVNPKLDFNFDSLFSRVAFPACSTSFPTIGMSKDMARSSYLQFNPLQKPIVNGSGLDMGINPHYMGFKRINSTPVSVPETFVSLPRFNIPPTSIWEADPQNLYNLALDQGRSSSFPSQPFTGQIGAGI